MSFPWPSTARGTTSERVRFAAIAAAALGAPAIVLPGAAGASETSLYASASASGAAPQAFVVRQDTDGVAASSAEDAEADADSAADDGSDPFAGEDDGSGVDVSDGGAGGSGTDDDGDPATDPGTDVIPAVVVDFKRRTVSGPRTFALSRTVKVSGITWTGWNAATTTGRGRVVVKKKSRRGKTVRGAGTVVLSGLKVCPDATPLYRKATVTVAGRKVAKLTLPGCSAMR